MNCSSNRSMLSENHGGHAFPPFGIVSQYLHASRSIHMHLALANPRTWDLSQARTSTTRRKRNPWWSDIMAIRLSIKKTQSMVSRAWRNWRLTEWSLILFLQRMSNWLLSTTTTQRLVPGKPGLKDLGQGRSVHSWSVQIYRWSEIVKVSSTLKHPLLVDRR